MVKSMTLETKRQIVKDYQEKILRTKDICIKYSISAGTLQRIIEEMKVLQRKPTSRTLAKNCIKCKCCGNSLNPKESNYCFICGKPLLTDRQLIIKRIERLIDYFEFAAVSVRDNYVKEVNDIIANINKLDIKE